MSEQNKSLPFPFFIDIKDYNVLVVGAGKIAERRILTLLKFTENITVVAKDISEAITNIQNIKIIKEEFTGKHLTDVQICIACTDNREVNSKIATLCKERSIHHSIADAKDECSFFFPGVVTKENVVIAVCGDGTDHKKTKATLDRVKDIF